jgi:hypothetical protein
MRQRARIDVNQPEIVAALRAAGAAVASLAAVGKGVPDLLVSRAGVNYLLEVKASPRSKLTPDEAAWHAAWQGPVAVVYSVEEALAAVGLQEEGT